MNGRAIVRAANLRPSPRRFALLLGFGLLIAGAALVGDGVYIKAKASLAQALLERAWRRALVGAPAPKPWPWADVAPVARLEWPDRGRDLIVLSGVSGEAMAFGPGLMEGLAPLGAPGLSVIAAHRDTHFRFLETVAPGDAFTVRLPDGRALRYAIVEERIVRADRSGLATDAGQSILALTTCYPFGASSRGPLRYVALARLTNAEEP